ncbi:MAG: sulfite exporter TauE/SafE family protein [Candidatus Omnitrophota bacterium]
MQGLYFAAGLLTGILSGFFGIGGGVLIIPILIYFFHMTQHQAQGTTLALLTPPVFFLAAWKYYVDGHVKLSILPWICVGFFLGGWLGAAFAGQISDIALRKYFGGFLLFIALQMILSK